MMMCLTKNYFTNNFFCARNFQQRKIIGPPPVVLLITVGGGCGGGGGACSSNVGMSGGRLENESVRAAAHGQTLFCTEGGLFRLF
jgi:hypothetical protein